MDQQTGCRLHKVLQDFYEPSEQNLGQKCDSELQSIPRNVSGFQCDAAVQTVSPYWLQLHLCSTQNGKNIIRTLEDAGGRL